MLGEEETERFRGKHGVGYCLMPEDVMALPLLSAGSRFMAPKQVDSRDLATPTEEQGGSRWCVAYAAAGWAEGVKWKTQGYYEQIDPAWIYAFAKEHDGMPNEDGTTITAALEALRGREFPAETTRVKVIRGNRLAVKSALHKYGMILGGFDISADWYAMGSTDDKAMIEGRNADGSEAEHGIGGHCVLLLGYDRKGVWFQNSWGWKWMRYGIGKISWGEFDRQFLMGGVLAGCLTGTDGV